MDFIQNSGRLKGAVDQVIADTIGVELHLNPKPNAARLGWTPEQTRDWIKAVKAEWKAYAWNARECDHRGKLTVPQQLAVGLRWYIAFGEVTGLMSYFDSATRSAYGVEMGTKACLVPPSQLRQDTNELDGLFQGVRHDGNGRPVGYLFDQVERGIPSQVEYPAFDQFGMPVAFHIFDPNSSDDVRGISALAPIARQHIQHETLREAALQTVLLQTVFAAVLTSSLPSAEAIEGLRALSDDRDPKRSATNLVKEMQGYIAAGLESAAEGTIRIDGTPQVATLAPGEDLQFRGAEAPGEYYSPLAEGLDRDMARAIGVTYGSYTMDHRHASYSSVRMDNATIWPVVTRRREHISAPQAQIIYEPWLDECIATGRIPFPNGGYAAFRRNRQAACWSQWQGPERPTADDYKSERARSERLSNGSSSLTRESASGGFDADEIFEERLAEHRRYQAAGMRSPYDRDVRSPDIPEDPYRAGGQGQ